MFVVPLPHKYVRRYKIQATLGTLTYNVHMLLGRENNH